jgi:hypothetical protein
MIGSEPPTNLSIELYTDAESRFSIHVPVGWLVDYGGLQGTRVLLYAPGASGAFRANINVIVHSLGVMTDEEYLALSRLQMKQMSGCREPDVDMPAPHGQSGRIIEWHAPMGPMHIKTRQLHPVFRVP